MHLRFFLIAALVASPLHSRAEGPGWGREAGGLKASLSAEKTLFHREEPILVSFRLKNVSERPQIVWHSGFWPNHQISVKTLGGQDVPLTPLGIKTRTAFGPDAPRRKNAPVALIPDETDTPYGPYDLRDYFKIKGPATLHVRCVYADGAVKVSSNELVIKVQ